MGYPSPMKVTRYSYPSRPFFNIALPKSMKIIDLKARDSVSSAINAQRVSSERDNQRRFNPAQLLVTPKGASLTREDAQRQWQGHLQRLWKRVLVGRFDSGRT